MNTTTTINFLDYKCYSDFLERLYCFDDEGSPQYSPLKRLLVALVKGSWLFEDGETDFDGILEDVKQACKNRLNDFLLLTYEQYKQLADRFAVEALEWHVVKKGESLSNFLKSYKLGFGSRVENFSPYGVSALFDFYYNELKEACGY